jgi:hypothetical protein
VRVSSTAIRIYDGDARLLGRLSPLVDGWRILRVDGSTLCQVSPLGADTQLDCDWGEATLGGDDDRLVIHVDGEEWLRLVAGEGWWTETPGQPDALGRWSDGSALSIQTHPDAWSHTAVRPEWGAPSVIAWSLDFPGVEDGDDRLMGGTLAYLMARRLAAAGGVAQAASTSDGSAHSSSVPTEGEP